MTECFASFSSTVPFSVEDLSKEEDLKIVWKEKVEKVFFHADWTGGKMRVETTQHTKRWEMLRKGGTHTRWQYQIKPDDIMESDFTCKYDDFIYKFGDEMKCHERLSCMVLVQETAVIALSKSKDATRLVSHFVKACLIGDIPFDENYFDSWFCSVFESYE